MKFVDMTWAAFLARHSPVSTRAKPACINITRNPVTKVHTMLMDSLLWATLRTSSEPTHAVVLPASSNVGSPVPTPVFGSDLAGAGQARSTPVPLLLTVPVELGATEVAEAAACGAGLAAGAAEAATVAS